MQRGDGMGGNWPYRAVINNDIACLGNDSAAGDAILLVCPMFKAVLMMHIRT